MVRGCFAVSTQCMQTHGQSCSRTQTPWFLNLNTANNIRNTLSRTNTMCNGVDAGARHALRSALTVCRHCYASSQSKHSVNNALHFVEFRSSPRQSTNSTVDNELKENQLFYLKYQIHVSL